MVNQPPGNDPNYGPAPQHGQPEQQSYPQPGQPPGPWFGQHQPNPQQQPYPHPDQQHAPQGPYGVPGPPGFGARRFRPGSVTALVILGIMLAGRRDGARVLAALIFGAVLYPSLSYVIHTVEVWIDYGGGPRWTTIALLLIDIALFAIALLGGIMAMSRGVSRWFAERTLRI